ncbi:hypothetical protein BDV23DRAFT_149678 [Aspergillus alliaceus]|uniref:Uncharacterized protein n=1 Tax=Petromyces alliaceus TaxID=209559 RepID=A0A5N7CG63_PETAA|nr:hypothetical protein BDV23DRAFT_149678 [Aspergillus alliaceus]
MCCHCLPIDGGSDGNNQMLVVLFLKRGADSCHLHHYRVAGKKWNFCYSCSFGTDGEALYAARNHAIFNPPCGEVGCLRGEKGLVLHVYTGSVAIVIVITIIE